MLPIQASHKEAKLEPETSIQSSARIEKQGADKGGQTKTGKL